MSRHFIIFFLITLVFPFELSAQSNAVKKAAKSVFVLTTYKEDGTILSVTHGVYFGNADEGISSFKPFVGAYKASVSDAAGNNTDVETIIGANDMYDICRFRLARGNGVPLPAVENTASGNVWVAGYSTKQADITPLTIKGSEKFLDKYDYYIFNEEINQDIEGCPILTDEGEVIGLVQQAGSSYDIHSTDCRYYSDLNTSGLSSYDDVLRKTHIRINLPADREQARLMLMTIGADADSVNVVNTANDYISRYPLDIDGYSAMANYEVQHDNLQRASDVMETAIKKFKEKDVPLYEYAKLIYGTMAYWNDSIETVWSMGKAEENVKKAISINDAPVYRHLLAKIKYTQGEFDAALGLFEELTESEISNSEIYYEVAQCKGELGAPQEEIYPYIDKAVEACPQPLTKISAPYVLSRGMMLDEMGEYKRALQDYNLYDSLMLFRADGDFYYTRGRCEIKVRRFQQAINDLAHAVVISPQEVTYMAELAALQLRVGHYDEALQACELSLRVTTDYSDIYIVQGVAFHQLGRDEEALEALQKAKDLGDERADSYMEKYGLK